MRFREDETELLFANHAYHSRKLAQILQTAMLAIYLCSYSIYFAVLGDRAVYVPGFALLVLALALGVARYRTQGAQSQLRNALFVLNLGIAAAIILAILPRMRRTENLIDGDMIFHLLVW